MAARALCSGFPHAPLVIVGDGRRAARLERASTTWRARKNRVPPGRRQSRAQTGRVGAGGPTRRPDQRLGETFRTPSSNRSPSAPPVNRDGRRRSAGESSSPCVTGLTSGRPRDVGRDGRPHARESPPSPVRCARRRSTAGAATGGPRTPSPPSRAAVAAASTALMMRGWPAPRPGLGRAGPVVVAGRVVAARAFGPSE